MQPMRWGVLGTGNIVNKGGPALEQAANGQWLGIAGRTAEGSAAAQQKFALPRKYDGYQDLLDDPEIDAVYIALLNHMHKEWALRAVRAGKHVLLEKPFALNRADAQQMIDEANKHNVYVQEAFVWQHMEGHAFARELIRQGKIGDPVTFRGHFAFQANAASTRLVPEWGGGALYDLGCYLVAWSRYQFEAEPVSVDCRMTRSGPGGVDLRFGGMMSFSGGRTAHVTGALDMPYGCGYEVLGTAGTVRVHQFADQQSITLRVQWGDEQQDFTTDRIMPFRLQAEHFAERARAGTYTQASSEAILSQARAMDALFASDVTGASVFVSK